MSTKLTNEEIKREILKEEARKLNVKKLQQVEKAKEIKK
jgi:hypothetical protein